MIKPIPAHQGHRLGQEFPKVQGSANLLAIQLLFDQDAKGLEMFCLFLHNASGWEWKFCHSIQQLDPENANPSRNQQGFIPYVKTKPILTWGLDSGEKKLVKLWFKILCLDLGELMHAHIPI